MGLCMNYNHETRLQHKQHECDTNDTSAARVKHDCYKNDTSATRVKKFDFDHDTSENIFSHPHISYMGNEKLQGEEQFHCKNYLSEILRFHAKMRLKSAQ